MLNSIKDIVDWRYDLPNCYYIISSQSADQLTDMILEHYKDSKDIRFVISEIPPVNRQGWLPNSTWEFMNKVCPNKSSEDKKD